MKDRYLKIQGWIRSVDILRMASVVRVINVSLNTQRDRQISHLNVLEVQDASFSSRTGATTFILE
jgi:hypothetical protein